MPAALAQTDTGARRSGNWNDGSIWTGGLPPSPEDNVYIGSSYPAGSATTATVTLTQNESANVVYVGDGNQSGVGTLDLGSSVLTANKLYLGSSYGSGSLLESAGGSFSVHNMEVDPAYGGSNSLSFGPSDTVSSVTLAGTSATTVATGNVTGELDTSAGRNGTGYSFPAISLGADLQLSGNFTADTGSVSLNGHSITTSAIILAGVGHAVSFDRGPNPGYLTANTLSIGETPHGGMPFSFIPTDSFANVYLSGSTVSTAASSNITGSLSLDYSTVNLGADLNLSGTLEIQGTGIVDAHHHDIAAN
jgi:hypothetical protein